jgi:hypothetical protein
MQEELQGKLVEILTQIQSTVGQAKDFTLQQLPDIAQSYIYYGMAINTMLVFISLVLLAIGLWFFKKGKFDAYSGPDGSLWGALIFFIFGVTQFALHISEFLLVWFAPKVWLLKEIAVLLK